jgi:hypothetical protein
MSNEKKCVIHAVVAQKKKEVHIFKGKQLIKKYSFKTDIPFTYEDREFEGYDWGEWSVADRGFTYTRRVKVWDEKVVADIRFKALAQFQLDEISKQNLKP